MSDAPERIWIDAWGGNWSPRSGGTQEIEYIRADRIEALTEQLKAARADAKEAEAYAEGLERDLKTCRMAQAVMDNTVAELEKKSESLGREVNLAKYGQPDFAWSIHKAAMADRDAKLAKVVQALRKLHHAVCGETGFAACVRLDSGLAYPWPALDEADEITRAVLAEVEGEKG